MHEPLSAKVRNKPQQLSTQKARAHTCTPLHTQPVQQHFSQWVACSDLGPHLKQVFEARIVSLQMELLLAPLRDGGPVEDDHAEAGIQEQDAVGLLRSAHTRMAVIRDASSLCDCGRDSKTSLLCMQCIIISSKLAEGAPMAFSFQATVDNQTARLVKHSQLHN